MTVDGSQLIVDGPVSFVSLCKLSVLYAPKKGARRLHKEHKVDSSRFTFHGLVGVHTHVYFGRFLFTGFIQCSF
jgi:hypothetical protein